MDHEQYHEHACNCGAVDGPHETAQSGCPRVFIDPPSRRDFSEVSGQWWVAEGDLVTEYTMMMQWGYWRHPCGCWSRHPGVNRHVSDSGVSLDDVPS